MKKVAFIFRLTFRTEKVSKKNSIINKKKKKTPISLAGLLAPKMLSRSTHLVIASEVKLLLEGCRRARGLTGQDTAEWRCVPAARRGGYRPPRVRRDEHFTHGVLGRDTANESLNY